MSDSHQAALVFLGAVGTVTGSKFLVDLSHSSLLVDAGLYQGLAEHRRRNWDPLPVDVALIEGVVLSHAHLDHTGYLPRLVKDGFGGRVICTEETAELAAIVLRDSAHLQQEDAQHANAYGYSKHQPALPLYDARDVEQALALIAPQRFNEVCAVAEGVTAQLRPAGHILGSATVELDANGHRVLFSGDLGRPSHPLLRPPAPPPVVDTMVVESTYGDRKHPTPNPEVLADAVRRTLARGGNVLIPAFAVDRTELILLELDRLRAAGEIPEAPVYVDSPMALASLEVYRRAAARGGTQFREDAAALMASFDPHEVHRARTPEESMRLNRPSAPSIVISASGMASGGRIVHHLAHQLPDPRNSVVLTGYQAQGTRGRQLLEGARQVKIHGHYVRVSAEIIDVPDFSVHSDSDETLAWLAQAPRPPACVYVVHGERASAARLAGRIRAELGWLAVVPSHGERVLLD